MNTFNRGLGGTFRQISEGNVHSFLLCHLTWLISIGLHQLQTQNWPSYSVACYVPSRKWSLHPEDPVCTSKLHGQGYHPFQDSGVKWAWSNGGTMIKRGNLLQYCFIPTASDSKILRLQCQRIYWTAHRYVFFVRRFVAYSPCHKLFKTKFVYLNYIGV
jgi:hypothetical protein